MTSSPDLDFESVQQYTLFLLVEDAEGLFDTATLLINVTNVNEAPETLNLPNVAGTVSLFENHTGIASVFIVNATDPEADALFYSFTSTPSGAPFTISATGRKVIQLSLTQCPATFYPRKSIHYINVVRHYPTHQCGTSLPHTSIWYVITPHINMVRHYPTYFYHVVVHYKPI